MASRSELTLCSALFLLSCPAPLFADKLQITSNPSGAAVELDGVAVGATLSKRNSRATPTGGALSRFSSPAKSPSRPLSNRAPEFLFSPRILPVTQTKLWSPREAVAYLLRETKCPLAIEHSSP